MRKLLLVIPLLFTMPVMADTQPVENRVGFTVTSSAEVPNDTLVASLFSEASGTDMAVLANKVNTDIRWASDLLKKTPQIRFSTRNYNTQPVYRKGERSSLWRVQQTVQLESSDAELLSHTVGALQERLGLQSLAYKVSDSASEAAREKLIDEALTKFRQQASRISENLSYKDYKIIRLNIHGADDLPIERYPLAEMRMMKSAAAPPVLEAGQQTLQVTVSAEIELSKP